MATADLREPQNRLATPGTIPPSGGGESAAASGGLVEAACGLAVIALSIAGLAHAFPVALSGIAQIVFGAGLLCADGAVVTCFSRYSGRRGPYGSSTQFSGLGAEAIGGLAGIVLGILTLVGLVPVVLCAVTVLVFGASVILGGAGRARVAMRAVTRLGWPEEESQVAQEAHAAALGGRALIGLAAVVLGILGIVFTAGAPVASLVLSLVGLLCLGVGALLSGSAFGGQAMTWNR